MTTFKKPTKRRFVRIERAVQLRVCEQEREAAELFGNHGPANVSRHPWLTAYKGKEQLINLLPRLLNIVDD